MTDSASTAVTSETVERLHTLTTHLHVPIYFAREAEAEYAKEGVEGRGGYFGSRTAAMGELSTESVIATFYNFSPDVVGPAMEGMWETTTAKAMQLARWRLAALIFDVIGRDEATADPAAVAEANTMMQGVVDRLDWGGRIMAAGNYDVLGLLAESPWADDNLVRLWQLATIVREWRGDAHIALLTTEPLSPVECTVVTNAQYGGFTKASRGWDPDTWGAAVARLIDRGWISDEDTLTDAGKQRRHHLEQRTNELSTAMWAGLSDGEVNRLGDLLAPVVDAVVQSGRLKPIGVRPRES